MTYDVVIIGANHAAFSAAYHLIELGIENITIIEPKSRNSPSLEMNHAIISTYFDQITRIDHNWSQEFRDQAINFSTDSYSYLKKICKKNQLGFSVGEVRRLGKTNAEKIELEAVYGIHKNMGFHPSKVTLGDLDVCFTGEKTISLDADSLTKKLVNQTGVIPIKTEVVSISEADGNVIIENETKQNIRAQMVIITCYEAILKLMPFYQNILIPCDDQWALSMIEPAELKLNDLTLMNFSNIWFKVLDEDKIIFGGARFMRDLRKVGRQPCSPSKRVSSYITNYLKSCLKIKVSRILTEGVWLNLRPCDEMPIIGPHPGSGRIFVASGFMDNQLPMGIYAGKCLAELINEGRSPDLPRFFAPTRFVQT